MLAGKAGIRQAYLGLVWQIVWLSAYSCIIKDDIGSRAEQPS
jgi:hypothetical protein